MTYSLGLDFGTTNSVFARHASDGQLQPLGFAFEGESHNALRTALGFWKGDANRLHVEAGAFAIRQFIENPWDTRFLQSIKTFAASASFQGTNVFSKRYQFEDLLEAFVARFCDYTGVDEPQRRGHVVIGRPVTFAGAHPQDQLAMQRYDTAFQRLGFERVTYVYEPVAAAFFFARALTHSAMVLVADFGGGTTDFSVVRFEVADGQVMAKPLGHGGIGIAGDHFDFRIIDHVLLSRLGRGSKYDSMGKTLELPRSPFAGFARWNLLSVLKTSREFADLKKLLRYCHETEKIQTFIDLVENNEGYPLYKAVSEAKMRLSFDTHTELKFPALGEAFAARIERRDFESWIKGDLERIASVLDGTLARSGVSGGEIEKVFLTGGTSFIPAIRHMFALRFGADRIESGDELVSVANGLALIAGREDCAQWGVNPRR